MPKLGESVVEGTVLRWLKREGEAVKKYEPLAEVVTDKVNSEIPSPAEGTVARLTVAEGATVAVGVEIAQITTGAAPTDASGDRAPAAPPNAPAASSPTPATAPAPPATREAHEDNGDTKLRSSPLVRRLAKEHGINVDEIQGTGTGGRVRKEDILAYIEQRGTAPAPAPAPAATPSQPVVTPPRPMVVRAPTPAPVPTVAEDEEPVPLTQARRAIAEHMVRSLATSPHTWTYVEVDVSGLTRWRRAERETFRQREGFDLTYVPFVCKALVETLREHPMLNSTWRDGQVILKKRINLGVAVALEDNLVVPVVRDADRLNIAGLAHALDDLVTRARDGKLKPDDVQGGTFTLNNTGSLGSLLSKPIINQPQAAILTMEAIQKRVVVIESPDGDDAIAIRPMMNVCISFDHRICDGLQVGRFMQALKKRIEGFAPGGSLY
jgi:2-oxoisovalerate dehydrogenase E2 component (dihydrolipoyl transacylase)